MRTIAVVNRKGGSGKTTTAVSLAAALAERGLPVLLIDLDPQGSASAWLGHTPDDAAAADRLVATRELGTNVVKTKVPGLDLVRSSPGLQAAERTMKGELGVGVMRAIQRLRADWAFVIIDCPPSLSYLSVGALMGVREVIIPVEAHSIAVPGVGAVVREIGRIQSSLNPVLGSPLIVACRVNRTLHARQVLDDLERMYGYLLARASVRESIKFAAAEAARQPITEFAPESGASVDYRLLAEELLAREVLPESAPPRVARWRQLFRRSSLIAPLKRPAA
ncbi:MAG TPA: ParA family protein [Candidatus Limnocylindrales bacterium]|nr:ParA family protein [Candidatus Limnocylindrales bacterium]